MVIWSFDIKRLKRLRPAVFGVAAAASRCAMGGDTPRGVNVCGVGLG